MQAHEPHVATIEESRHSSNLIEWDSWFDEDNNIDNQSSNESSRVGYQLNHVTN